MSEPREERRIVTVLVADVVGSSALAERLDPEDARLIIGGAISRCVSAVESFGGTVKDLAGDSVLTLFGAPLSHEDDAERALRAALEILAAIEEYSAEVHQSWGLEFAMRLGIDTGEVVVGPVGAGARVEYGAVGDAVNTAARLQTEAGAGGILVSEATRRNAADLFEWGEAQTLRVKGKERSIVAYSLRGVQPAGHSKVHSPMVGRDAERRICWAIIDRLTAGHGGLLFVHGEPGIGKSRLATELRRHAAERSQCMCLEGRCVSYGESLPYWLFRDLLRNWLEIGATEPEIRARVKLHRSIEQLFPGRALDLYPYLATILGLKLEPDAAAQLSALSPESLQHQTFTAFTELITRLASSRPLIVSIEDLHWADRSSLLLLEQLLPVAETASVVLAINHRPDTDHESWRLKENASREYRHIFHEVALHPLPDDAETALLDSLVGHNPLPHSLRERLLTRSGGNPFFLEQLVRALTDRITPDESEPDLQLVDESIPMPQSLEAIITARIDRLEPGWRDVVRAASILGRTFSLDLLEAVTGTTAAEMRRVIHHLLRLDLFNEETSGVRPVYRFKHALIQEAASHTLVAAKRAHLHRRAAEWFEDFYRERPERVYGLIAHHWLAAGDIEKAAHYMKLAGDQALLEWALEEAIGNYRALLPLLEQAGHTRDSAETLFQLASTLHLAMRYREANSVWQVAFDKWKRATPAKLSDNATLRIAVAQPPWDPDPAHGKFGGNVFLQQQLYDRLLDARPGPYFVPGLADRWEVSEDGRLYRFHLSDDATTNSGETLTATDVLDGIHRTLVVSDPSALIGVAAEPLVLFALDGALEFFSGSITDFDTVGVHALDDRTVEFRLRNPFPSFLFTLASPETSGARLGEESGPFRLKSMAPDHVVIERDPRYKRRRGGNVAAVEWVRADADAMLAFRKGEFDVISLMVTAEKPPRTDMTTPLAVTYLAFGNGAQGSDINLRRAIAHATDRNLIEPLILPTDSLARGGLVPPGIPGHSPEIAPSFDPDAARRSLAESAYHGPLHAITVTPVQPRYWDSLVESWREILGLEVVTRERADTPAETLRLFVESADIAVTDWAASYPDPEYFLWWLLHTKSTSNTGRWSYTKFDELLDRARTETDGPARLSLFREADKMAVSDQCAVVPLTYNRTGVGIQPWVHGWWTWSVAMISYDAMTVDETSPRYYASQGNR